jgi:hypothetical protein
MRKTWQVIAVTVVGLGLSLALVGCGSQATTGKDNMMSADKMSGEAKMSPGKLGDKMSGENKMSGNSTMATDKMSERK